MPPPTQMLPPAERLELETLVTPTPHGIAGRILAKAGGGSVTLFAFDAGQGLTEHTSPFDALVLVLAGSLTLTIGDKTKDIEIAETDTLDQVMSKINSSGLRVAATSFFDGTDFRLQLRGLDTGAENDVNVSGDVTFNFNGSFNVGFSLGSVALGYLAAAAGYPPVFVVGGVCSFAALALLAWRAPRRERA